jgi:tyrosinase
VAPTAVVSRESIDIWAEDSPKLWLFRKAVEAMQKISDVSLMDERGFQWEAGVHGGFGGQAYCQHGNDNFVTWHRPYLLDFEFKLRAQIARIVDQQAADEWRLPYWDWSSPDTQGIPAAFTVETYDDGGQTRPNPLFSMPYQLPYEVFLAPGEPIDPSDATWRAPGSLDTLRTFGALVDLALGESDFFAFSTRLELPHNRVHGWTNGFMATYRSSFDPLFWCHHANIDRQFWQWQQGEGHMSSIPRIVREFPCVPFKFADIRAQAFFDTRALGYTYAIERTLVTRAAAAVTLESAPELAPLPLDFGTVRAQFSGARINVHGVRHPERIIELRFFGNREPSMPPVDAVTPQTPAEHFLGAYMLLGHGPCPGAPGHCDPDQQSGADLRPPHHLAPFDIFIDVTEPLKMLISGEPASLRAEMIVVDNAGVQLPTATARFDNASLTFR